MSENVPRNTPSKARAERSLKLSSERQAILRFSVTRLILMS